MVDRDAFRCGGFESVVECGAPVTGVLDDELTTRATEDVEIAPELLSMSS